MGPPATSKVSIFFGPPLAESARQAVWAKLYEVSLGANVLPGYRTSGEPCPVTLSPRAAAFGAAICKRKKNTARRPQGQSAGGENEEICVSFPRIGNRPCDHPSCVGNRNPHGIFHPWEPSRHSRRHTYGTRRVHRRLHRDGLGIFGWPRL